MIKRIFIAGPKSGKTPQAEIKNIELANKHAETLVKSGDFVYVPHNIKGYIKDSNKQKKYF